MVNSPKVVAVVGAGLAGLRTVEHLRRRGYDGRIVLFGAEPHLPYDRPPLSKRILRGETDSSWLRRDNDYGGLEVDVRVGTAAVGLDVDRATVRTEQGDQPYDVAVLATGSVPKRVPGISGLVLRTCEDAERLRAELRAGANLAVVGAGLIGCEVAASARVMDVPVTLIDVLPGPLVRVLGPQVAAALAAVHEQHGVSLYMSSAVATSGSGQLILTDGTVIAADAVLEAIGARPDTDWLNDSQLALADGVVCDADGLAAPGVYAVGDVARWDGRRSEHWTSAGLQADSVAASILDQPRPPLEVPYWWSDQYDLKLQGLGHPESDDDVHLLEWGPHSRTVAVYSRNGALTGVVGFSAPKAVMTLRGDVAAGTDVDVILDRLGSPV